ncbi:hypothetical protein CEXT_55401 [Caerostris extrusa]|uniref:Uncharacterized protein n=1 Tax=Caerostris extrusa TaxID=172846 RepID=A0AAV4VRQ3_CAEEX|nr:hypothetical protein CEXT_55401 [Caerostris extrusa]
MRREAREQGDAKRQEKDAADKIKEIEQESQAASWCRFGFSFASLLELATVFGVRAFCARQKFFFAFLCQAFLCPPSPFCPPPSDARWQGKQCWHEEAQDIG